MTSRYRDPAKAKRAATHPKRPGSDCKAAPGAFRPSVNRSRCEGKHDCEAVCPYDVFEVGRMTDEDFRAVPLLARLKVLAHRRQTAYTPRADACQACGLCVVACPENAITLVPTAAG